MKTPFLETEILIAVMEGNEEKAKELLNSMSVNEQMILLNAFKRASRMIEFPTSTS